MIAKPWMAVVLLCGATPLLGQDGRLRVLARDATDGALVNAEVSLSCAGGNSLTELVDRRGVAVFADLPPGECRISVISPGFKEWRGARLVTAGTEGRVEARLEVGSPGTKVEVRPRPAGRRFIDWLSSCAR